MEETGITSRVKVFERLDLPGQILKNDYEAFHQSDHINYFSALCRLRNRLGQGFPVTAFIHSISYQEYMPKYLEMALLGPGPIDALICSSKCGKTVLSSVLSRLAERFQKEINVQMPVIPLGIDELRDLPEKSDARKNLGIADDEVVALHFGRFSEIDKADLFPLLQAFRSVVSSDPQARLLLAGSVHSPNYLKMLKVWISVLNLSDQVRIIADPPDATKGELFAAVDFFVSLSDNPQETFGLTLLEAMRAGLPLIVSDFDGYREIASSDMSFRIPTLWSEMDVLDELQPLMDERTFHLTAAQSIVVDLDETAAAFHRLFSDTGLRKRMGAASKLRFEACYTHRSIIEKMEKTWASLKAACRVESASKAEEMSLRTYRTFAHYVTKRLDMEMSIIRTPLGSDLFSKQIDYPLLPNMGKMIDAAVVLDILKQVASETRLKDLSERVSLPEWRFRYTILWMLKHELIHYDFPHCS